MAIEEWSEGQKWVTVSRSPYARPQHVR
jgi:hypothetical protein